MGLVLDFYEGRVVHPKGFTLDYVLGWDDGVLESEHSYIQWLFPLTEPSRAVRSSPLLEPQEIARFRDDPVLRQKVRRAFARMLGFYGFETISPGSAEDSPVVVPSPGLSFRLDEWLTPGNHNFLRITRILKSLVILGFSPEARAFLAALADLRGQHPGVIPDVTWKFWTEAAGQQD